MHRVARTVLTAAVSISLIVSCCLPVAAFAQQADGGQNQSLESCEAVCAEVPADASEYVSGELIVAYEGASHQAALEEVGAELAETLIESNADQGEVVRVETQADDADALEEEARQIAELPGVISVQPNYRYKACDLSLNDPGIELQSYLNPYSQGGANILAAWSRGPFTSVCTVGILDSGVDLDHPDLRGMLVNHDRNYDDDNGHGTSVAGIIAARVGNGRGIAGVGCNAVRLVSFKVLDSKGVGSTASVLSGYKSLLALNETEALQNLHVVNMSLAADYSRGYDKALADIITYARGKGIVSVCAGGNGDSKGNALTTMTFPADYKDSVSVTALASDGCNASFSDYNACKDISAPGVDIVTTMNTGEYGTATGTSAASPIVAGVLGLIWAKYPRLSVDKALDAIYKTADFVNTSSLQHVSKDSKGVSSGSHGALDADKALACLGGEVKSIGDCTVSGISTQGWTGSKITPKVKVSYAGTALVEGVDYKLVSLGSTKAGSGTAALAVVGMGNYVGWVSKAFSVKYDLSKAKVSVKNRSYNAKKAKPKVTVKLGGKTLKQGVDYKLGAKAHRSVGRYGIKIKAVASRSAGSKTAKYSIKPGKVKGLAAKKAGHGKLALSWSKSLAAKKGQVSGYEISYASAKNPGKAKIVRVKSGKATSAALRCLKRKCSIQIRSYKKTKSGRVYSSWSKAVSA